MSSRWWIYSKEPGGPWGPCEARDRDEAERIGKARMAHSGLTFVRVAPVEEGQ